MKSSSCLSLLFLAAITGCSSSPLEREEDVAEILGKRSIPRVALLSVTPARGDTFGSRDEWFADISRVFRELEVCTDIWSPDTARGRSPDMTISVVIHVEEGKADIETSGALLDVLAWSTIPLLPFWIRDVDIDPGISAKASCIFYTWRNRKKGIEETPLGNHDCPLLSSCHLDRHAFASWTTLGSVLLPPFVFKSPDPEHFEESNGLRVREEIGLKLAGAVKSYKATDPAEPLCDLGLEKRKGKLALLFNSTPDLYHLHAWIEPRRLEEFEPKIPPVDVYKMSFSPGTGESTERECLLEEFSPSYIHENFLLRIKADDRSGRIWRYSLPLLSGKEDSLAMLER